MPTPSDKIKERNIPANECITPHFCQLINSLFGSFEREESRGEESSGEERGGE